MDPVQMGSFDWGTWGPPMAVLLIGAVAGLILALRGSAGMGAPLAARDLAARKQSLMRQLAGLDADRPKLDPADYDERRAELLRQAAAVLRQMEQGEAPAATPATGGASGNRLMWAVGLVAFFAIAGYALTEATAPRTSGSMTGNQQLGGGPTEVPNDPRLTQALAALEKNPQDLAALNLATRAAIESQQLQAAMNYLDQARAIDPEDPGVLTHLAALQMVIGRHDQAEAQLRQALAKSPDMTEAQIWLALATGNQGRWDEAAGLLQKIIDNPAAPVDDRAAAAQLLSSLEQARGAAPSTQVPADHPAPTDPPADQPSEQPAGPVAFSGKVVADAPIPPGGVLFVYARASETGRGPPLAAKRFATWQLPLDFSLSSSDMIMGGSWPEQVWLNVRIARSGDPMVRSDDDVSSAVIGPLTVGTEGVEIKLGG